MIDLNDSDDEHLPGLPMMRCLLYLKLRAFHLYFEYRKITYMFYLAFEDAFPSNPADYYVNIWLRTHSADFNTTFPQDACLEDLISVM